MSPEVQALKAEIYDQVVINNRSREKIVALEQQLLALLNKEANAPSSAPEKASESVPNPQPSV